ncbi:AtzE family amidohydrolase [Uliginosibacterium sp. H1]|uniref:AtzE family amidohydrolase n=1 Tax=Uliginosibacterium sp. H1 TaxID=3114757 RepID=UPI002E179678|nr:AtzE family amidohydrolase [Uliginosibacterium sp. H1]
MSSSYLNLPAWRQADAIANGEVTARALAEASLQAIASRDVQLRAYTDLTSERALAEADAIDIRRRNGETLPPLAGVPYAVKNLFDIAGMPTLAGGHRDRAGPPAQADATLVQRCAAAGSVLLGALNMDAYAYGFTTENSFHGTTRNPLDDSRVAGGSSGGSAAAVAAGLCAYSLGSDTNGSIRVPSSFCGTFGLKPTFGGLSRGGSRPFVHDIDHVGPFARSARDLARIFDALAGRDPLDAACRPAPAQPTEAALLHAQTEGLGGLRVARLTGWFDDWAMPEARAVATAATQALGGTREVEFKEAALARAVAFIITASTAGELYRDELREHYAQMEPANRDRLLAGSLLPAAWLAHAQRARRVAREAALKLFEQADLLIAPATPCVATRVGAEWLNLPTGRVPARPSIGLLTQPISSVGLPVVAVPMPTPEGLPIAVQIIAAPGREDLALAAAGVLENTGLCFRHG